MKSTRIALITGANQGIGFAIAEGLLKQGVTVVLTSRNEEKGMKALERLKNYSHVHYHQLDINDIESIQKAKTFIEKQFGKLDILVNNAAINYDTWHHALNANLEEVESTLNTNLMGAWRVSQVMIPLMQKQQSGKIINVSSGAGTFDSQTGSTPAYSLSKLALNALTMQLSTLLKSENIFVNSVCPGWVRTQMGGKEAPRSPEEGAETVLWLALNNDKDTGLFFRDKKIIQW